MMETYIVGGAVRDTLMGRTPKDLDYVVVGGTPEALLALGYTQVGADFPVFLHPESGEEYALARTERKSGRGYNGFAVDASSSVTLEEDLGRRDLTINSMAMRVNSMGMRTDGTLVDPYNGRQDLLDKVLRHTTEAFREDPLRLLRVARFLARLGPDWTVAPETLAMLQEMVRSGEVDHLTPERVWKEFEKGLSEAHPWLMLAFLHKLDVFNRPPFKEYAFEPTPGEHRAGLEYMGQNGTGSVAVRFALAMPRKWTKDEAKVSRLPAEVREITHLFQLCCEFEEAGPYRHRFAEERLKLLETLDALRQKKRFLELLDAVWLPHASMAARMKVDVARLESLSNAEVIGDCKDGKEIARRLRAAKLARLV